MAIGKLNAYATVQAPNVDFGDIALNAQKFQDVDFEKRKDLLAAKAKAEKPEAIEVPETGNFIPGGYSSSDATLLQSFESLKNDLYDIGKRAQEAGGIDKLSIEDQIKFKNGNKAAESFSTMAKQTSDNIKEFINNHDKASGVSDGLYDIIASTIDNPSDVEHYFENGNWVHRIPVIETDKENNRKFVYDTDGRKTYKQWYNSDGNLVNSFTQGDLQTKAALRVVPKVDIIKRANEIQNIVKATIGQTDTGVVKVKNLYYTNKRVKDAVDSSIENAVSDRSTRLNLLYDIYSEYKNRKDITPEFRAEIERYSHPMREDEYTEKDMNNARNKFKNLIEGGFGNEHTEDIDNTELNRRREEEFNKYRMSLIPNTIVKHTSPDVIKEGFVTIIDAKPTADSGYSAQPIGSKRIVQLPAGSTLTGVTKGVGGSALIRVAVPLNKTELYKVAQQNGWKFSIDKFNKASEEELASYTKGKTTKEAYYRAPEVTVNSMLQGNSSIKDYDQVLNIVVDKNWKPRKNQSQPKQTGKSNKTPNMG